MKKTILMTAILSTLAFTASANSDYEFFDNEPNYTVDTDGAHAFVSFKINHMGFSWLRGRFDEFEGKFHYDSETPENSQIFIKINTESVNSNHEARDKHLRNEDFLFVPEYPEAYYVGNRYEPLTETTGTMHGELTLRGVTNNVTIDVQKIGQGTDGWGNDRVGFTGTTEFKLKDFGIDYDLGEASQTVHMTLDIEGIKID